MKKQTIKTILTVMAIGLAPVSVFAAENAAAANAGISDAFLLSLLLGVILLLLLIIHAIGQSISSIGKIETPESKSSKAEQTIKAIAVLVLAGGGLSAYAQNETTTSVPFVMSDVLFWSLITTIAFLALIIAILFRSLKTMIRYKRGDDFTADEMNTVFDTIGSKLVDRVPVEEEATVMLDHDYDGIKELDNNLPPWWKYMFYGTIIFAFVYLIRFHITGSGELQLQEYESEMLAATEAKAEALESGGEQLTEDNVTLLVDLDAITTGANIYKGNCATCHGALAEGLVGPNLTDEYWIHGGGISNIFKSIKYGIPAKGMIAWQSQFSPVQMQQIASYIISIQGSNPPNAKDPQGEIWVDEKVEETPSDTTNTEETVEENEVAAVAE
ncbi:cbb3-type cytochrome c oxidase N-terminal domain-containing protein [Acidiluteibacter ferrifornacis]|uniref:C-type cytochrome n=1 Tax=Acidiluteibacter ferrifornacis TaxID=2692424 RepID=A0A6N9NRR6_9FLAO|nr:cbb3-type cytochrome c oxidase N-terminal domain-containing protein [Acidiluteibacter ferrifornacis]NBG67115.1 c-type cytochrome [Acidiluteibacter ferrifornacis]